MQDADSFYHRAIYGEWPASSASEPVKVRLELAKLLARNGRNQELLSELLLLQNQSSQNLATKKQIASLFLQAGSASRAADAYRNMMREHPDDPDTYLGLGQAEIASGDYRAAVNAFERALRRQPNDLYIQSQLQLADKLANLDPTSHRLGPIERYRRSSDILALAQSDLNACRPNAVTEELVKPGFKGQVTNELAEARLDDAERLWKLRSEVCKDPPSPVDPLTFLMKKLSPVNCYPL